MRVISGRARGTTLKSLDGLHTRPTADRVKEAMFSIIQFDLPAAKVLDLFGGSGQLGIEALSRGAESAVFVDNEKKACSVIRENLRRASLQNQAEVVCCDYKNYLDQTDRAFDIILLDPPYSEVFLENSLKMITEIDILQSGGIIVTERPFGKEIPDDFPEYIRSKDYKYGNTLLALYRKV